MTRSFQTIRPLWPASQLFVTADTSGSVDAILHPRCQLKFLDDMTAFAGPDIFADSLVYSTSRGNTGWTAFRMGSQGHATYHHWDGANPNLLQLDVFGLGVIDDSQAIFKIREFWIPLGLRAILIQRDVPSSPIAAQELRDDTLVRTGVQTGLGPGRHHHLLVDFTGRLERKYLLRPNMDRAMEELVLRVKMNAMTPVVSQWCVFGSDLAYSSIVGITTSHISIRLTHVGGVSSISMDVFSCRNFELAAVTSWLERLFSEISLRRSVLLDRYPGNGAVTCVCD